MKLEENRFNEIVAALRLADKDRDWNERRAYPRVPLQKCMAIIPYRAGITGEQSDVWVRDISQGGIGLVHMRPMEANDEFLIRLPQLIGHALMLCKVSYCAPLIGEKSSGLFGIGARFISVFSETETVATAPAGEASE
jgi:hypothetical protein